MISSQYYSELLIRASTQSLSREVANSKNGGPGAGQVSPTAPAARFAHRNPLSKQLNA